MQKQSNKRKNLRIILPLLFIAFIVLTSFSAYAQGSADNLDKPFGDVTDMGTLTNAIFQLGIGACVLAAAIYIAIGAFYYFVAAGSNAKTAEKGKEIIERAIIGLVLALVSWILLNTIHPQFTNLEIKPMDKTSMLQQTIVAGASFQ